MKNKFGDSRHKGGLVFHGDTGVPFIQPPDWYAPCTNNNYPEIQKLYKLPVKIINSFGSPVTVEVPGYIRHGNHFQPIPLPPSWMNPCDPITAKSLSRPILVKK